MNTPLTDAVDNASYPDPAAHREALRKLCRKLEETQARLLGQIASMHDEREAAEARVKEKHDLFVENWKAAAKAEARLRAVTEAGRVVRVIASGDHKLTDDQVRAAFDRWDALNSGDLPPHPDTLIVDWLASWWDSQCTHSQQILNGQFLDNPTGSFRDAVLAHRVAARTQAGKDGP